MYQIHLAHYLERPASVTPFNTHQYSHYNTWAQSEPECKVLHTRVWTVLRGSITMTAKRRHCFRNVTVLQNITWGALLMTHSKTNKFIFEESLTLIEESILWENRRTDRRICLSVCLSVYLLSFHFSTTVHLMDFTLRYSRKLQAEGQGYSTCSELAPFWTDNVLLYKYIHSICI